MNQENNNSTWEFESLKTALREHYYIHRVKASLFISPTTPLNASANLLVNFTSPKFIIGYSNKIYTNFHGHSYSPLEAKILVLKDGLEDGKPKYKHWAYIDYVKNIIHVDGMYPEKRIQEFIDTLKEKSVEIAVEHTNYSYVEICCRHPYDKFDDVAKALDKLAKRFAVGKTNIKTSALEPDEEYSHLIKNLYIDGYCNIKTYKHILEYAKANQKIDQDKAPKLEIQLVKPKSLEVAKNRGIAVLKAVISSLKIPTLSMESTNEKPDYTRILESDKISQNEKVSSYLNKQEMKVLPTLPDDIVGNANCLKLVNEIYFEAKPSNLICERLGTSKSTFRRTLWQLGSLIERRGSQNPGYLYGIDTTQLNNKYHIRSITKLNSKSKNIGKALGVLLLLIICTNILNSYHFSSLFLKTSIDSEEPSRLKSKESYLLFNSDPKSEPSAHMIFSNSSLINNSTNNLEHPNSLLIDEQTQTEEGENP